MVLILVNLPNSRVPFLTIGSVVPGLTLLSLRIVALLAIISIAPVP